MSKNRIENLAEFNEWVASFWVWDTSLGRKPNWAAATKYVELAGGVPDDNNFWIFRELLRSSTADKLKAAIKCYMPTVFDTETWLNPLHFVHVSGDDNTMLAFTPDADKGKRDVQIKMSVAKYLGKYYKEELRALVTAERVQTFRNEQARRRTSGLNVKDYSDTSDYEIRSILADEDIKKWADKHREKCEEGTVYWATDADEIEMVYCEGPQSCMDGRADQRQYWEKNTGGVHPVRAYAGPDVAVAYTKRDGRINARTVCHIGATPPRYTRIYGDVVIATRLKEMGFVDGYSAGEAHLGLSGARLLKLPTPGHPDHFILPYLDAPCTNVRLDGDYIRVDHRATSSACTREGKVYIEDPANHETCPCCGALKAPKHFREVHGGERVCSTCVGTQYATAVVARVGNENRTGIVKVTDTAVVDGTCYLNTLPLATLGLIQLRDGSWTKQANAVKHFRGGYVKKTSGVFVCGVNAAGEQVYAMPDEIRVNTWRVGGNAYAAYLYHPHCVPKGMETSTLEEYFNLVVQHKRAHGRGFDNTWVHVYQAFGCRADTFSDALNTKLRAAWDNAINSEPLEAFAA